MQKTPQDGQQPVEEGSETSQEAIEDKQSLAGKDEVLQETDEEEQQSLEEKEAAVDENDIVPLADTSATDAEASYSLDGGNTWTDCEYLADVFWETENSSCKNPMIRLKRDVTVDIVGIVLVNNKDTVVTLNGNGHTIKRGNWGTYLLDQSGAGTVIYQNIIIDGGADWDNKENASNRQNRGKLQTGNAHLIFSHHSDAVVILGEGAVLQNNHMSNSGYNGAAVMMQSGSLIMKNGAVIRYNTAVGNGTSGGGAGAVHVGSGASFTMEGGEIYGNYASVSGGAIVNEGTFELKGGEIHGNAAGNNSGAIAAKGDTIISGGKISQNTAIKGGGVYNIAGLSVSGNASITQNTAPIGGGIYSNAGLSVSGTANIAGNTGGNVYLPTGKTITVDKSLAEGADIGVTTESLPTEGAPVDVTTVNGADYSRYFRSDNGVYTVRNSADNKVQLAIKTDDATGSGSGGVGSGNSSSSSNSDNGSSGSGNSMGTIIKNVEKGEGIPDTGIATSTQDLADILLTEEEKQQIKDGLNIQIILEVQDAQDIVSNEDKAIVEQAKANFTIGQYLDVNLFKVIGANRSAIYETSNKLTITIAVPESLKNTDDGLTRRFAVIRVHNGQAETLSDLDDSADTITIQTDRFSTYAIVYRDTAGGGEKNKDKEPKTGDTMQVALNATLAMISGFAYLLLYFSDHRRGMTEKRKKELISAMIKWAGQGGKIRRPFAAAAIFALLVYYHSIGKKTAAAWTEAYGK